MKKLIITAVSLLCLTSLLHAQEDGYTANQAAYAIDNLFILLAAILVLLMQAGFAMLECGLNSSRSAVNVLAKNLMDMCIGVTIFWIVGFGIMYPGDSNGFFGFAGFGVSAETPAEIGPGVLHPQLDYLFQAAFAAATATIISGAIAGRMNFLGYLLASLVFTGFLYPIQGMWKWGGGFLDGLGYLDFAGSMVVHGMGGFAALAAILVLGARKGRFDSQGRSKPMPGHSIPLATLGTFLLIVGWYGFNPGSQLAISTPDDISAVMKIAVNTTLAAGLGGIGSLMAIWLFTKKADLTMVLNGILGGLVAVCCACDALSNVQTMILGFLGGIIVVASALTLEKLRIDDAVGAVSVHGTCGAFGVLFPAIIGLEGFAIIPQLTGFAVIAAFAFITSYLLFTILKLLGLGRVTPEVEDEGLDAHEHGLQAYPDILSSQTNH